MANHGATKICPLKMTLSSILYIIILEINNIILYWGRYAHASAYARCSRFFVPVKKKSYQEENFLIYGFVNPT